MATNGNRRAMFLFPYQAAYPRQHLDKVLNHGMNLHNGIRLHVFIRINSFYRGSYLFFLPSPSPNPHCPIIPASLAKLRVLLAVFSTNRDNDLTAPAVLSIINSRTHTHFNKQHKVQVDVVWTFEIIFYHYNLDTNIDLFVQITCH